MLEKIEEMTENKLFRYVVAGCSASIAIAFVIIALVAGIATFVHSIWWLVVFCISTIISGATAGLFVYLSDLL